jgi:Ca-activated chloride channel family protein
LRENGANQGFQRDENNEVVITKLNKESLNTIAKATKGGYVDGNNTKEVLDYVKNALDNIQKTEFETTQYSDFSSQFQWFLGLAFLMLIIDSFLSYGKTKWVKKLNLFNESKSV